MPDSRPPNPLAFLTEAGRRQDAGHPVLPPDAVDLRRIESTFRLFDETLLRDVLDTASVSIFLIDTAGRIVFANRRMAEMFACPAADLIGSEYVEHIHPDERKTGWQRMLGLLNGRGDVVDVERKYWRNDGVEFWGRLTARRFLDRRGDLAGWVGVVADSDGRRRAMLALRNSEAAEKAARRQAEAVLSALPDLLFEIDDAGRVVDYRAARSDDAYVPSEFFVGQSVDDILPPEAARVVAESVRHAEADGHHVGGTYALDYPDGRRWFELAVARKQSDQGARFILLARNISERRRVENDLVAERTRFRDLVDSTSGIVWEADARTMQLTFVSKEAERLLGFPAEDWYAPGFRIGRVHHDDLAWTPDFRMANMRLGGPHNFEYRFIAADGRTVWLRDIVKVVFEAGEPRWLRGVMFDITDSKRASQRHAGVISSAMDGFVVVDPQGRITECNDALCEITGYTREEMLRLGIPELEMAESPAETARHIAAVLETGRDRFESRWRRKDGDVIDIEVTATHLSLGKEICAFVRDITRIKAHQRELDRIAHYDALTGVPNRTLLADRLRQAIAQTRRAGDQMAVCYLDLDGFKPVNDTYGHEAGDQVLVEIAARLQHCVRAGDTVARIGGDEFVLILQGLEHSGDGDDCVECDAILQRILDVVAEPIELADTVVVLSVSLGASVFPRDDSDADTLLRHADQSMYIAKQTGKNRYHVFDPEHDRVARDRNERLGRIRQALEQGELVLHFQPQVDMRGGHVEGVEALVRWQHPERGLLPPADFLPLIEDTDLIVDLGNWVIGAALEQLRRWKRDGLELTVGINIAARHLLRTDFAERLKAHLAAYPDVEPARIDLEVLETAALDDIRHVSGLIRQCQALGVQFSLDDFGTGYSSLAYLKSLPANTLKVDQTFVRDMLFDAEDRAIVQGVIGLSRVFNRKVIAEGVESLEHGAVLLALGCDHAQGNGIARAMPAASVAAWVAAWTPDPGWDAARRGVLPAILDSRRQ